MASARSGVGVAGKVRAHLILYPTVLLSVTSSPHRVGVFPYFPARQVPKQ